MDGVQLAAEMETLSEWEVMQGSVGHKSKLLLGTSQTHSQVYVWCHLFQLAGEAETAKVICPRSLSEGVIDLGRAMQSS